MPRMAAVTMEMTVRYDMGFPCLGLVSWHLVKPSSTRRAKSLARGHADRRDGPRAYDEHKEKM